LKEGTGVLVGGADAVTVDEGTEIGGMVTEMDVVTGAAELEATTVVVPAPELKILVIGAAEVTTGSLVAAELMATEVEGSTTWGNAALTVSKAAK